MNKNDIIIELEPGFYNLTERLFIHEGLHVRGHGKVILDSEEELTVVILSGASISDCEIRNSHDCAVLVKDGCVLNCVIRFSANRGIKIDGAATVSGCTFVCETNYYLKSNYCVSAMSVYFSHEPPRVMNNTFSVVHPHAEHMQFKAIHVVEPFKMMLSMFNGNTFDVSCGIALNGTRISLTDLPFTSAQFAEVNNVQCPPYDIPPPSAKRLEWIMSKS